MKNSDSDRNVIRSVVHGSFANPHITIKTISIPVLITGSWASSREAPISREAMIFARGSQRSRAELRC
ncbi:hypothetical protein D3C71_1998450 [compost metagenome]